MLLCAPSLLQPRDMCYQPDLRLPADSAATAASSSVAAEQPPEAAEEPRASEASAPTYTLSGPLGKRPPSPDEETWGNPPKRRVRAKPDGRCQIRAVLHASKHALPLGVTDILTDDSREARDFIRRIRSEAAQKLQAATEADETLQMIVSCSL